MPGSPDPLDVRTLYATMPGDFVAARNELAAHMKDAGDAAGAKQVKALRRPTVAAWAVDALAREHAGDLEGLIRAGEDLAAVQRQVAAGGGSDRLREATEERRRIIDRLVRAAADALGTADMPAPRATLDKVADTLNAIASDQGAAEQVLGGVLDKELPPPAGFGDERMDAALLASVTELPRGADPATGLTPQQQRKEQERVRRVTWLSAEATELEEEADRLERSAKEAAAAAASAGNAAAAARRRADAARRKAEQAEGMKMTPARGSP
jgi:hypothetical protein